MKKLRKNRINLKADDRKLLKELDAALVIVNGRKTCPIWSPFDCYDAADRLVEALEADKAANPC